MIKVPVKKQVLAVELGQCHGAKVFGILDRDPARSKNKPRRGAFSKQGPFAQNLKY
jgi:hypothetical protein